MAKENKIQIHADTKLKLIAIDKKTFEEHTKEITYSEWLNLKKNNKFYYKAVQI